VEARQAHPCNSARSANDHVRLDPLDPKTARHAGQCEFNGVTDPAMLRAVLRVTRKDG
jgi:hypothetical protein